MSIAQRLTDKAASIDGVEQWPYLAAARALMDQDHLTRLMAPRRNVSSLV